MVITEEEYLEIKNKPSCIDEMKIEVLESKLRVKEIQRDGEIKMRKALGI